MRLIVKRGGNPVTELRFTKGPIYIGRQIGSQVFLPDRAVSRQHAVIYSTTEGKWIIEDLDSANKTYLNNDAIHKSSINERDIIRIADFNIEILFESEPGQKTQAISLADTLTSALHEPQITIREINTSDAALIQMPARRTKDFYQACREIHKAKNEAKLLSALLDLMLRQLRAFHVWGLLRAEPSGPTICQAGRKLNRQSINIEDLPLRGRIDLAMEKNQYMLIPRMPMQTGAERIRSAIITPVLTQKKCLGVLYVDNALEHEHYSMADLDYLMMVSIQVAAVLENKK